MTDNPLGEQGPGKMSSADLTGRAQTDGGNDPDRDDSNHGNFSDSRPSLFLEGDADMLRRQWAQVQASFVDEPRRAVADADSLVASAMNRLSEIFSDERSRLESQWDRGEDVSTEDLRIAMQRYRSFFERLLAL